MQTCDIYSKKKKKVISKESFFNYSPDHLPAYSGLFFLTFSLIINIFHLQIILNSNLTHLTVFVFWPHFIVWHKINLANDL